MFDLKLVLLLAFLNSLCLCQEGATKDEEIDSIQVVNGKKEKKFERIGAPGNLYNPYLLFNYPEPGWKASANLTSDASDEGDKGTVSFHQWGPNNFVRLTINATGLPPGKHAVHIHAFGDVSQGCKSTGPHMPSNFIGNIDVKEDGTASTSFFSPFLTMFGYHGIVGRSVVIHEKSIESNLQPDVFSSPYFILPPNMLTFQTEESQVGPIIACGPITITDNKP